MDPILPIEMRGPDFVDEHGTREQWVKAMKQLNEKCRVAHDRYCELHEKAETDDEAREESTACLYVIFEHMKEALEENGFVWGEISFGKFLVYYITGDDKCSEDYEKWQQEEQGLTPGDKNW